MRSLNSTEGKELIRQSKKLAVTNYIASCENRDKRIEALSAFLISLFHGALDNVKKNFGNQLFNYDNLAQRVSQELDEIEKTQIAISTSGSEIDLRVVQEWIDSELSEIFKKLTSFKIEVNKKYMEGTKFKDVMNKLKPEWRHDGVHDKGAYEVKKLIKFNANHWNLKTIENDHLTLNIIWSASLRILAQIIILIQEIVNYDLAITNFRLFYIRLK